ncbi:hypothetical protein CPU12_05820 [Malaciobacter molluscorum LMG 25693]|uniref:Murein L,D-transpeptidase n=1 Tax=Malaciobacter molluscorum LMG 25693 TaxID=870501 RepID=A0A2G1DIB1_9BACT|nr:L,D-transpeptidase family protein [Malaciobacter molluscorum]AXX91824.1 murein L,D-transpeptidase [Malaciobacter molluscorum LMG 25693]PHO18233.1 hypothetical protein CPU12_05820 [Malaciobacter molluscorum LMG 25693]
MIKILILFLLLIHSTNLFAQVDLVKVIKSKNLMYLMDGKKIIKTYKVSLGANPKGHKEKEGDEKTPEGTYILDYVKSNSSFYKAMHISYPNKKDKINAKKRGVSPGGFIMVHGQKNGFSFFSFISQNFNWTNGCIAITNKQMDEFLSLVKVGTKINIVY